MRRDSLVYNDDLKYVLDLFISLMSYMYFNPTSTRIYNFIA